jgi:hypothetical protein
LIDHEQQGYILGEEYFVAAAGLVRQAVKRVFKVGVSLVGALAKDLSESLDLAQTGNARAVIACRG